MTIKSFIKFGDCLAQVNIGNFFIERVILFHLFGYGQIKTIAELFENNGFLINIASRIIAP